jgi:predicted methyltransferase
MTTQTLLHSVLSTILIATAGATGMAADLSHADTALAAAVANPQRPAAEAARDRARHPLAELTFFGLAPRESVVEIWPGAGYWTAILGPYLAGAGHYYVALPAGSDRENASDVAQWRARIGAHPKRYGAITETTLDDGDYQIAPAGSADLVLTFRNLHNWMNSGYALQVLQACFRALKPGGILGIEDHRGRNDRPQDPKAPDGYVRQDYAIALAKQTGFELVGTSEIDANPRDTKDWVGGVWTLPPTLSQGKKDRAHYLAVGEADNFVLKFRKPIAASGTAGR